MAERLAAAIEAGGVYAHGDRRHAIKPIIPIMIRRHGEFWRWPTVALGLLSMAMLSACGVSAGDAEQAITDQSHERLTEPECREFDSDYASGETTFECSAAQRGGRRIKLMVDFGEKGVQTSIIEWPCVSAKMRWRAIRAHPALHCGKALGSRRG